MESLNDALIECVKALGGSKQVAPKLWPEKEPEAAQRLLLDCLNEDRPAKLSPDHVLLILRMCRHIGFHGGIGYILDDLGYAEPVPIEPRDELADLLRQNLELQRAQQKQAERIEHLLRVTSIKVAA